MLLKIQISDTMSKKNAENNKIKQIIEYGTNNKKIIPQLQNWCAHLQIKDVSGGIVAQRYNIPIRMRLSCKHASAGWTEVVYLEQEAERFITQYCIGCTYRKELSPFNLGQRIIREFKERNEETALKQKKEELTKKQLKISIENSINAQSNKKSIPKLSILNLVAQLEHDTEKEDLAKKILKASLLEPTFFDELVLNALSIYFDDKEIGDICLDIVGNINGCHSNSIYLKRVIECIENNCYLDNAVKVLIRYITKNTWTEYQDLIFNIVSKLRFKRFIGESADLRGKYPNTVNLFQKLINYDYEFVVELLRSRLQINDKDTRINSCFFIQDLLVIEAKLGYDLIDELILSLEFDDDDYETSADAVACETICHVLKQYPDYVIEKIFTLFSTLSEGAKEEFISIYYEVFSRNQKDYPIGEIRKKHLINFLSNFLFSDAISDELERKYLRAVKSITRKNPELFIDDFDLFLNRLKTLCDEKEKFEFYKKDLKNEHTALTFNPLLKKHYIEIQSDEISMQNKVRLVIDNLANIFRANQSLHITNFTKAINERTKGNDYKSYLIEIVKNGCKDTNILSKFIPTLYNLLLAEKQEEIREKGFQFLSHIIQNHPQLITDNFVELILIFLNDEKPLIRGYALDIYHQLLKVYPNKISNEQIISVLNSLGSNYLFVRDNASKLLYTLFKFLNSYQKVFVFDRLVGMENYYFKGKKYEQSKEIVDKIFWFYAEDEEITNDLVKDFSLKYCAINDYYTVRKAIKELFKIQKKYSNLSHHWIKESLKFLKNTHDANMGSDNPRSDIFTNFYEIDWLSIKTNKDLFVNHIETLPLKQKWDIHRFLQLLAYNEFHQDVISLCDIIVAKVPINKSNEHLIDRIELIKKFSSTELLILQ